MEENIINPNRNNDQKNYKELKIESNNWSNILLGNQFLKQYFNRLGISDSLIVNRIVKMEDFKTNSNSERIQFVIVRSKLNEENIERTKEGDHNHYYSRFNYSNYEKTFFENNFLFFVRLIYLISYFFISLIYFKYLFKILYSI